MGQAALKLRPNSVFDAMLRREFLAEKSVGGQKVIRLTQTLKNKVAQAGSHGLAYLQGSREDSDCRSHPQYHRKVRRPEENQIAKQQPA